MNCILSGSLSSTSMNCPKLPNIQLYYFYYKFSEIIIFSESLSLSLNSCLDLPLQVPYQFRSPCILQMVSSM